MLEVISAGVRMTTIDSIGNIPTIQNGNVVNNQPKVNFRASAPMDNPVDSFISEQENAKTKMIEIGKQKNICSQIMLYVKGNKKARVMLYEMGLGKCTGFGFGAVTIIRNESLI